SQQPSPQPTPQQPSPQPPPPPEPAAGTKPQIGDSTRPEPPPQVTLATANPADTSAVAQLAAGVTGNGVIAQGAARRPARIAAASGVSCGFNEFRCYTRIEPGQKIRLLARPLAGYVFKAWSGACAGQGVSCVIVARALKTVTAIFAPRAAVESVGLD